MLWTVGRLRWWASPSGRSWDSPLSRPQAHPTVAARTVATERADAGDGCHNGSGTESSQLSYCFRLFLIHFRRY